MKKISFSFAVVVFTLCAAAFSFGQTQSGATAVIPSVYYEILNHPDSPLTISIQEKLASRISAAPLKITNIESPTVTAYVLRVNGGTTRDYSYMVFAAGKGLARGESRNQAVSVRTGMQDAPQQPVISIDHVLFADGKTWGADSVGRSKDVRSFIEGHGLAVSRLKKLLEGKDDKDFMKLVEIYGSSSYGAPVSSRHRTDYFAKGYEAVINGLRRMKKNVDEAKELARKLEVMGTSR